MARIINDPVVAQLEEVPFVVGIRFQIPSSAFTARPTKSFILPGSASWYQTYLGRIRC